MRTATSREEAYRWHAQALTDIRDGIEPEMHPDEPHCGWFQRTLVGGGVMVPCRIWLYAPTDLGSDELIGDEEFQCEVDGQRADAFEQWSWLCRRPITEAQFHYMTALRRYAEVHEPHSPWANPRKAVDWLKAPLPEFSQRKD